MRQRAFENDDAQAWAEQLPLKGARLIEETLERPLDAPESCEQIVAAAEAVVALSGDPHLDWPPHLRKWLRQDHRLDLHALRINAAGVMLDIMSPNSPLRQQWTRFGEDSVWLLAMGNLVERLKNS